MGKSGFDRFKHNRRGYEALMRSAEVAAHLDERGERVKAAALAQLPSDAHGIDIIADTTTGRTRAGATVIGIPMRLEHKHRILGRAMDAAR